MSDGHTPYLMAAFVGPAERSRLESAARDKPMALEEIAASDRLRDALDSGRTLDEAELDVALVALALLEPSGSGWAARLRARIDADTEATSLMEIVRGRREQLESGVSARAHFEKISGHRVGRRESQRWAWMSAAAIVLAIFVHGAWSLSSEDPLLHEAWMGLGYLERIERGSDTDPSAVERARQDVYLSRSTFLGLWPRYDLQRLERAERTVAGHSDIEALLLAARIQIMLGRPTAAQRFLDRLPPDGAHLARMRELETLLAPTYR